MALVATASAEIRCCGKCHLDRDVIWTGGQELTEAAGNCHAKDPLPFIIITIIVTIIAPTDLRNRSAVAGCASAVVTGSQTRQH